MRKLLRALLASFFLLFSVMLMAQQRTIRGKVVSSDSKAPLQGVSITVKGTPRGTQTDIDGNYVIKASTGETFVLTSVGFAKTEVKVGPSDRLDISMATDSRGMSEVVVTAMGIKKEKRALGYAAQDLKGEEIAQTQRENFINSIQGRVAGATVTATSGAPGASSQIVLRGFNSLSGNNSPLFVVDGLPMSNNTFSQGLLTTDQPNRNLDYQNRIADLNPDDIESVTVLKGPEATALYGIEAGSGAIIITTKRGKRGKLQVSYDNNFRFEKTYRYPEYQTTYDNGLNGLLDNTNRLFFGPKYEPGTFLYNNVEDFYQTGFQQKHNFVVEGGGEKASYRGSATYWNQSGVIPTTRFERFSTRFTTEYKPFTKLTIGGTINYVHSYNKKVARGSGGYLQNLLLWPHNDDASVYLNADGTRRKVIPDPAIAESDNPYWDVNRNIYKDFNDRFMANFQSSWDATNWFNFTARMGVDAYNVYGNNYQHPESNAVYSIAGRVEDYTQKFQKYSALALLTFKHNIGKLHGTLRLGASNDDETSRNWSVRGDSLYVKNVNEIENTSIFKRQNSRTTGRDTLVQKRLQGVFGEFTLNYDDWLYLTATGRNDWTSTLPKQSRSFFYSSLSGSFVFTELLPKNKVLSFGKLRGSFAETAKDIPPYQTQSVYTTQLTSGGGFAYGFTNNNPGIVPERQKTYEFGTELRFFSNRFGIDATYYNTLNKGQIVRLVRLSYGSGFILSTLNVADTRNEGLEVVFNANWIRKKNFRWTTNFNFAKTRNKVLYLPANIPEYYNSDTWLDNFRGGLIPGGTTTTLTGTDYLRNNAGQVIVDPSSGLPAINGTYTKIAERNPDFNLGIQNLFSYKTWSLSFLLDIKVGGDIMNGTENYLTRVGLSKSTEDREKPIIVNGVLRNGLENTANPTPNNIQITPHYVSDYYRFNFPASAFVEKDVNWVRLRDITLQYNVPAAKLSKNRVFQNLGFFVTGTDLFIITNYSGVDPAVNGNSTATAGVGSLGVDYLNVGTPRGINFGVRTTFKNISPK